MIADRLPGLRLRLEPKPPEAVRTTLVILDAQDRELARRWIHFSAPMRFRGFTFHPSQVAPESCAIEVVREPGLWLVETGCASFLLGCAWMFYLKPVLKRREARP